MKNYKEFGCIYLIQNSINNKKYIGQTTRNFNYRFNEHYNNSKKDKNMVYLELLINIIKKILMFGF